MLNIATGSLLALSEEGGIETRYKAVYPSHGMVTDYAYNSTNQVVKQRTPDAGVSKFWYDKLSRLVFSQNASSKRLGITVTHDMILLEGLQKLDRNGFRVRFPV